jgi:hypothetical protein
MDFMKHILTGLLAATFANLVAAQNGLFIAPGAQLTMQGNAVLTLHNANLENNGTFQPGNGLVRMTGSAAGTISGTNPAAFFNLLIANSGGIHLQTNVLIANELDLSGMLHAGNSSIQLGRTATIVNETELHRITDLTGNNGHVTSVRNFDAPLAAQHPGNLGVEFVSAPTLGTSTITRYASAFAINGSTVGRIHRYYDIQPANNSGLNASVRFYYLDAELNNVSEATAVLWKSSDNGLSWTTIQPDSRNTTLNYLQKNDVDDFSLWTIGGPSLNSPLPVLISSFNSECKQEGTNLVWTTAMEQNSDVFILEKSKDGFSWNALGTIDAKGTAGDYKFTDKEAGTAYYRLKQVDLDGTTTYSTIIRSDCEVKKVTVMLYPNPATDYTELVFNSDKEFNSSVQIFNNQGQIVKQLQASIQKGNNKIRINLPGFSSGTYIIRINHENLNVSKTFIKQ